MPIPRVSCNAAESGGSELLLRVGSALVLAPLAVGVAYLGGWPFVVFWAWRRCRAVGMDVAGGRPAIAVPC